jgi:hypothetical protein
MPHGKGFGVIVARNRRKTAAVTHDIMFASSSYANLNML